MHNLPWQEDDRLWFIAHPERRWRVRAEVEGEMGPLDQLPVAFPESDFCKRMLVAKVAADARARTLVLVLKDEASFDDVADIWTVHEGRWQRETPVDVLARAGAEAGPTDYCFFCERLFRTGDVCMIFGGWHLCRSCGQPVRQKRALDGVSVYMAAGSGTGALTPEEKKRLQKAKRFVDSL